MSNTIPFTPTIYVRHPPILRFTMRKIRGTKDVHRVVNKAPKSRFSGLFLDLRF